ncbi:MAG TPA: efflux RND transporter periplasmic adaptor subunit [Gemmatimonadales bacterium]|nr:efflux RND transporter periplasmic adaptor subunit [Gemmatimonadales bacterium]
MRPTLLFLLGGVLLAACDQAESDQPGGGRGGPGAGAGGPPAMPVEVVTARRDTVVDAIAATGQIEAMQSIELRPEVEGRLVAILVREGAEVPRGAPLFRIDDAEAKAQLARAEAEWDLANQALRRTRQLLEQDASSAADLERAEAEERSTRAQVELLRLRVERSVVRAPFAGVVGRRLVSLGDYVTTNTPLVTLQTVNPQRATFHVPERYARALRTGQRVTFRVAALPGEEFSGTVDFVDPVVELPARTILVKAQVPNGRRELQPGMFIEARLATEIRPDAVIVPEDAILPLQGANFVWVVAEGKATRRQVGLGVRVPGFVEVRSGVDAGEQVVVGGQERLFEGAAVNATVVERDAPRPEEAAAAAGAATGPR